MFEKRKLKRHQKEQAELAEIEARKLSAKGQIALDARLAVLPYWAVLEVAQYTGRKRDYYLNYYIKFCKSFWGRLIAKLEKDVYQ